MSTAEEKLAQNHEVDEAERSALIDQICASLGARYHDLQLFKVFKK